MEGNTTEECSLVVQPVLHLKNISVEYQDSDPNATKLLGRLLEIEDGEPV